MAAIPGVPGDVHLEYKHFFGGAALFAEGRICMSITHAELALKLPPETKDRLLADSQAEPLRYFPNGPVKRDYALFPDGAVESDESFGQLALESIQYALSLPKPKTKLKAR